MIQHKIAEMAVRMFASESTTYRVVGAIEAEMADNTMLKAVEEFATECSFIKVFASETLDYVVDECVQIHGGYGFSQEYSCEHAYRDSRINRIFEGTNEINRLLATGMMLKRAQKGTLALPEAVKALQAEILSGPQLGGEIDMVTNAKKVGLFALGVAFMRYMTTLEEQQEVVANITDILMNAYAMESAMLRAEKIARSGKNAENAKDMAAVFAREAMDTIESAAKTVLAACGEGDALRTNLAVLKRFTKYEPVNVIGLRRKIAARMIEAGKYTV
jgi:hypothetical protein